MIKHHITNRVKLFTILTVIAFSVLSWNAYGFDIISHELESSAIAKNKIGISSLRHIEVYLPDGYDEGKLRYPVIYWIPGLEEPANGSIYKNVIDNAIKTGKILPVIVVFVDVFEGTWFLNSPVYGNWEDFMVLELIPFIDKTYRTVSDMGWCVLMGHSAGGYSALMLPILHPNVWSAIGANDPSIWAMWMCIRDEADFTEVSKQKFSLIRMLFQNLPQSLEGLASLNWMVRGIVNFGSAFSPNPEKPLFFDPPITPDGNFVPEVREKLKAYDLTDTTTIAKNYKTLKNLLSIAIVVPEIMDSSTNKDSCIDFIDRFKTADISVTRLDMPGGHISFMPERFIALAEVILKAMQGNATSVSSQKKMAIVWGEIKR